MARSRTGSLLAGIAGGTVAVLRIVLLEDDYHVLDRRGGLHAVMTLVVVVIVRERRRANASDRSGSAETG
ncbi:MAG TPA: hypothetical protein VFW10_01695 [Steroidobacteraceae bacterium]|nr:hypothetical protein [Steroidobacteraceae bacterium]